MPRAYLDPYGRHERGQGRQVPHPCQSILAAVANALVQAMAKRNPRANTVASRRSIVRIAIVAVAAEHAVILVAREDTISSAALLCGDAATVAGGALSRHVHIPSILVWSTRIRTCTSTAGIFSTYSSMSETHVFDWTEPCEYSQALLPSTK